MIFSHHTLLPKNFIPSPISVRFLWILPAVFIPTIIVSYITNSERTILPRTAQNAAVAAPTDNNSESEAEFVSNELLIKVINPPRDNSEPSSNTLKDLKKANKYSKLVRIAKPNPKSKINEPVFSWYVLELKSPRVLLKDFYDTETNLIKPTKKESRELQDLLVQLSADPAIVAVEPNFIVRTSLTPNDLYYSTTGSWGQSYDDLWGVKKIRMSDAWDITTGNSITVANIDTGIDATHLELANAVWINSAEIPGNGVDDDANGYIDDYRGWDFINNDNDPTDDNGHGTHTAGTIAAAGNNDEGFTGVAWNTKIMSLKFLGADGYGTVANSIQALQYAADHGAKISSNSWTGLYNKATNDAVAYEHAKGMVVVVAAGNNARDALDYSPASSENAITVSASDANENPASFSNYGEKIDVAAPGVDILSAKANLSDPCGAAFNVGEFYCRMSGTSMATPHVSGVAALLLSHNPALTNENIRQFLRFGADDLGVSGKDNKFGFGRLNAYSSLQPITPLQAHIADPTTRAIISTASFVVQGTAAGENFSRYTIDVASGRAPTSWRKVYESTQQVVNGNLGVIDTANLSTGRNIIRLTVYNTTQNVYQFTIYDVTKKLVIPTATPTNPPLGSGPVVSLTNPSEGASVSGKLLVTASATDPDGIAKVEFYIDGKRVRTDTAAPFDYSWSTTIYAHNSHHTIYAQAFDTKNIKSATDPITVSVLDITKPQIVFTTPTNGGMVTPGSSVPISAQITDVSGINRAVFYVNNSPLCTVTDGPYTCNWIVPVGVGVTYTLKIHAYDTLQNNIVKTIKVVSQ